jgi:hypothetical protein
MDVLVGVPFALRGLLCKAKTRAFKAAGKGPVLIRACDDFLVRTGPEVRVLRRGLGAGVSGAGETGGGVVSAGGGVVSAGGGVVSAAVMGLSVYSWRSSLAIEKCKSVRPIEIVSGDARQQALRY